MNKLCTCVLALLLPLLLAAQPPTPEIDRIGDVLQRNFQKSKLMVALTELEWRPGLNTGLARLAADATISQRLYLEAGREYAFIGTGGPGATDLDLYLRGPGGSVLASDLETDNSPVVIFTPARSGPHVLQLHLSRAAVPEELVAFNILVAGGTGLSEEDFQRVNRQLGFSHRALTDLAPDLRPADVPGQWLVYGMLVNDDAPVTLEGLSPTAGECYVTAAGSEHFERIDLYLAKPDGTVLSGKTDDETVPLLIFPSPGDTPYRLRVEGSSRRGPEFLLLGFYER